MHHAARGTRTIAGALGALLAVAACKGDAGTGPNADYPYDVVVEARTGTSGPPTLNVIRLSTGEATRLLTTPVGGMHPAAALDGSRIAFARTDAEFTGEIFLTNRTGTELTNLSNHAAPDLMPAWAPNGQRLAFVTDRAGYQDIFVINTNGTGLRRITDPDPSPAVTTEWWPAWSPDGQQLAYSSTIDGTPDIWTTTVDATPISRSRLTGTIDTDLHPSWSPDVLPGAARIAFQRQDQNTGDTDIGILNVSAATVTMIHMAGQQLWPSWSPSPTDQLIAFVSDHEGGNFELYTMRPDGTEVVRRTTTATNEFRSTWLKRP